MATGYEVRSITLLDSVISVNGGWKAVGRLLSPTVTVEGLETGGIVSVRVSNRPEKNPDGSPNFPDPSENGVPHTTLGNITSDSGGGLGGAFTFIRANKTANADGATATMTIAAPAVVTRAAHGFVTGDVIYFATTGALPTGVVASTPYYVVKIDANTFNLATSYANATAGSPVVITTTGTQSGTHTVYKVSETKVYLQAQQAK